MTAHTCQLHALKFEALLATGIQALTSLQHHYGPDVYFHETKGSLHASQKRAQRHAEKEYSHQFPAFSLD